MADLRQLFSPLSLNVLTTPPAVLWLRLLGGATLERDGVPVRSRATHRRRIALLALLTAARGRLVGREKVILLLWPEHTADAARRLLSESLYVLRKELGDGALVAAGDEVGIVTATLPSDLQTFEAAVAAGDLARAAEAYLGPFLDGFYVSDAPQFERWVDGERDRLARAYARTLEQLAGQAEADGRLEAAAEWWQRLAECDPANARVVLRLMRTLEAAGEPRAAIRRAEVYTAYVREELGAPPAPEVAELTERLHHEPVPVLLPAEPLSRPPASTPAFTQAFVPAPASPDVPAAQPAAVDPVAASVGSRDDLPALAVAHEEDAHHRRGSAPAAALAAPVARSSGWPWPTRRMRIPLVAVAMCALAALTALTARTSLPGAARLATGPHDGRVDGPPSELATPLDVRRIAVLYLDDHSEQQSLGYLADGLTESLIHELSQVRALHVVSRNGVKPFRSSSVPFDSIVRALRVGSVVEGSIQASQGQLRVTVQLIDGATGAHLESRTVQRPVGELFALEDDLAREVAGFLRRRLGREVAVRDRIAGTRSARARDLFLRAEQMRSDAARLATSASPLDAGSATQLLARADSALATAAATDPAWVDPVVARGWVRLEHANLVTAPAAGPLFAAAREFASQALAMHPGHTAALELRGTAQWRAIHLGRGVAPSVTDTLLARAVRDLRAVLAAEPTSARAWSTLSQLLRLRGDLPEADAAARRALEADEYLADAPIILERLYRSSLTLARDDEAARWCAQGRRQFPTDWRFAECELTLLGQPSASRPRAAVAWRLFDELYQLDPPDKARAAARPYTPIYRRMAVARVLARAGLPDSARAVMARARRDAESDSVLLTSLAYDATVVNLLLGDTDAALHELYAYVRAQPRLRHYLARDVQLRRLWNEPRFEAIVSGSRARSQ